MTVRYSTEYLSGKAADEDLGLRTNSSNCLEIDNMCNIPLQNGDFDFGFHKSHNRLIVRALADAKTATDIVRHASVDSDGK